MKFNSAGGVSVFELIIYFPALILAAIVCSRHGFGRSSGFVFTLILCLVRIIGACCQLATYSSNSVGLEEAVIILDSIGISPLLLATLGLLSRCVDSVGHSSSTIVRTLQFRILQLIITIGLILCIVGGTSSTSSTGVYTPQGTTKAGLILYVFGFVAILVIAIMTLHKLGGVSSDERWLVWAVLIALPLILVRLAYSLTSVFAHDHNFNLVTGSVAIHVVMAILEEMAVVLIYLAVGWKVDTVAAADRGPVLSRPWKGGLTGGRGAGANGGGEGGGGRTGGGRTGGRRMRQGPIHALVNSGIAAAHKNKEANVSEV